MLYRARYALRPGSASLLRGRVLPSSAVYHPSQQSSTASSSSLRATTARYSSDGPRDRRDGKFSWTDKDDRYDPLARPPDKRTDDVWYEDFPAKRPARSPSTAPTSHDGRLKPRALGQANAVRPGLLSHLITGSRAPSWSVEQRAVMLRDEAGTFDVERDSDPELKTVLHEVDERVEKQKDVNRAYRDAMMRLEGRHLPEVYDDPRTRYPRLNEADVERINAEAEIAFNRKRKEAEEREAIKDAFFAQKRAARQERLDAAAIRRQEAEKEAAGQGDSEEEAEAEVEAAVEAKAEVEVETEREDHGSDMAERPKRPYSKAEPWKEVVLDTPPSPPPPPPPPRASSSEARRPQPPLRRVAHVPPTSPWVRGRVYESRAPVVDESAADDEMPSGWRLFPHRADPEPQERGARRLREPKRYRLDEDGRRMVPARDSAQYPPSRPPRRGPERDEEGRIINPDPSRYVLENGELKLGKWVAGSTSPRSPPRGWGLGFGKTWRDYDPSNLPKRTESKFELLPADFDNTITSANSYHSEKVGFSYRFFAVVSMPASHVKGGGAPETMPPFTPRVRAGRLPDGRRAGPDAHPDSPSSRHIAASSSDARAASGFAYPVPGKARVFVLTTKARVSRLCVERRRCKSRFIAAWNAVCNLNDGEPPISHKRVYSFFIKPEIYDANWTELCEMVEKAILDLHRRVTKVEATKMYREGRGQGQGQGVGRGGPSPGPGPQTKRPAFGLRR